MKVDLEDVNFDELARCTEDFNGAQMKAVAVESGMIALRREATVIKHEDFMEAINGTIYLFIYGSYNLFWNHSMIVNNTEVVAAKKKGSLDYYA